jgi:hypothetical protein
VGVVVFDRLRDIDDVEVGVVIEDVVLGKIGVDEFAFVIHLANCEEELLVEVGVGGRGDLGFRVLESR